VETARLSAMDNMDPFLKEALERLVCQESLGIIFSASGHSAHNHWWEWKVTKTQDERFGTQRINSGKS
jgi:2-hydroxy-3-keto-5-methylthiopentenyl-1-phosphate phosphatase